MVAHEHMSGIRDISLGIFTFIDTVYRQALFVPVACYENGIGTREEWGSLSEDQFLAYFRLNVPEDGKEFLREKFRERPVISELRTRIHFAAMTHHFHRIFGLGPSPEWTESPDLKAAKLYDIKPLINRPISWAMRDPEERIAHFSNLDAARYAVKEGALNLLDQGRHGDVGRLILEGMKRANGLTLP